ncbi:MAG: Crp/Fnr family transcriptional regulator [Bacteroidales bacterium]|jgi:CRP-like cAMP-binding protein|nr:Crp/Fnr family transcriptional regulator [Bacteroidales bacterium]
MNVEDNHTLHVLWKNHSILRRLTPDEINYLEELVEIRTYKRNEIIFSQGKRINGCYIVLSGIVKQFKTGMESREYIFRLAKAYEILGFRSVLSEEPACNTSSVLEDCTVCYIRKECLYHLVTTNGNFAMDLLQVACRELEESHSMITDMAQKSLKERLAELLLMLRNKFGVNEQQQLNISLSREDLSNMVGTAIESVIRLLSEFKNARYVAVKGRRIAILDEKSLEKIAYLNK